MKTGHKYLDYKSKIDNQNDITKYWIKGFIIVILTLLSFLFCLFLLFDIVPSIDDYDVRKICGGIIIIFLFALFLVGFIVYPIYVGTKIQNLRKQRNVALGILLSKEFEKEEEEIDN